VKSIRLIEGPVSEAHSSILIEECSRRISAGRSQSFLYIVPSERKLRAVRDKFLESCTGAMIEPRLFTPNGLVSDLYRRLHGPGRLISRAEKLVILEQLLLDRSLKLPLSMGSLNRPFPGLVRKIESFISDLKKNLVHPEDFLRRVKAVRKSPSEKDRTLQIVYERYQKFLGEHELIDTEGMFWVLLEQAENTKAFHEVLGGIDLCVLDGIYDVTTAELQVLDVLSRCVDEVLVRVSYDSQNPRLFEAAKAFRDGWMQSSSHRESPKRTRSDKNPSALLASQLFRPTTSTEEELDLKGFVTIVPSTDSLAEVKLIARRIRQLAQKDSIPLSQICVAFPNLQAYAAVIREIFPRYGIPFGISSGLSLVSSPIVSTVLGLFSIIESSYHRRQVLRFFGSPYVTFRPDKDKAALDSGALDHLAREAGIIDGLNNWPEMLDAAANRFETILQKSVGEEERNRARADLEAAEVLKRQIALALKEIETLNRSMTISEFRETLTRLINRFNLPHSALSICSSEDDGFSRSIAARDLQALAGLYKVLDALVFGGQFAKSLSGKDEFSPEELKNMLLTALEEETASDDDSAIEGVRVMTMLEARGLSFEIAFLGGLTDSALPSAPQPNIFFSESEQRRLGLKVDPGHLVRERYLFYLCLSVAQKHVFLSYPQAEGEKLLLRSVFVDELTRIGDCSENAPDNQIAASQQELDMSLGQKLFQNVSEDTERELAALQGALLSDRRDRWLNVLRGVRAEDERIRKPWSNKYDGVLKNRSLTRKLSTRFGPEYPFSISALETYSRCGFRFFAARVLRLAAIEEPEEEILPKESGEIAHNILRRFYVERANAGCSALSSEENIEDVIARLREIGDEEFATLPSRDAFWQAEKDRMLGRLDGVGLPGILELLIRQEMQDSGRCKPCLFEVPFGAEREPGRAGSKNCLKPLILKDTSKQDEADETRVTVVGRIDRIDMDNAQSPSKVVVVDYKTGAIPSFNNIASGLSLQLPLYIIAVERGISNLNIATGGYIVLKNLANVGKKPTLLPKESSEDLWGSTSRIKFQDFENQLHKTADHVIMNVSQLRSGHFPLTTHSEADAKCKWCEYRDICRFDESRRPA